MDRTPRIRRVSPAPTSRSIAVLERVRIGDSDQWVLERSDDVANPVVLFLHGGPGTSELTLNRWNTRRLEQDFTVVNWDQRGAGKSYRVEDLASMNIEQFIEDTRELTSYLLQKFHQDRLVLVGHSWGSALGVLTAARYPELFSCYVGVGQVAHMKAGEVASYQWTLDQARARNDRKAVAALAKMGHPPYSEAWQRKTMKQRRYLGKFGGEVYGSRNGAFGFVFKSLVFSREYTLTDRVNFFRGIFRSMRLLWPQLLEVDLFAAVPKLAIPVFFMEGRHDHEVPSDIAEQYFESLEAPSKELTWFEKSAHLPNSEERERFNQVMIEKVLPVAVRRGVAANV